MPTFGGQYSKAAPERTDVRNKGLGRMAGGGGRRDEGGGMRRREEGLGTIIDERG